MRRNLAPRCSELKENREVGLGNLTRCGGAALACCSVSSSAVPEREERLMSAGGYCHFLLFPRLSGGCL